MWSGGLPRKFELSRSASFVLTGFGDDVGTSQRKIFAEKVGEFPRQVVKVAWVEMCESEFVEDGKKETYGADGHEGIGIVRTEDASRGTEEQSGLNAEQGLFLFLESRDDESVIWTRPFGGVGQFGVERENGTKVR